MTYKISIIYGSVRDKREGIKAAKFVENKLKEKGFETNLIDPLKYKLPLLNKMYKEYDKGKAPKDMEKLSKIFRKSDGYIIVASEYNHSIPSALKNILDHYMSEYFFKPSAIVGVSAGPFGGVRAAMTLRVILPEVGMPTIPTIFPISNVQNSFDKNGKDLSGNYDKRIEKFLGEFEWYVETMKKGREKGVPY